MQLDRMRMYEAAELLVAEVHRLLPRVRELAAHQADHLERSADSTLLNTAEGVGSFKPKVKISAYDIARKEANEVRAILRSLVIKQIFETRETQAAYDLAGACVGMLTRAIIAQERRWQSGER